MDYLNEAAEFEKKSVSGLRGELKEKAKYLGEELSKMCLNEEFGLFLKEIETSFKECKHLINYDNEQDEKIATLFEKAFDKK